MRTQPWFFSRPRLWGLLCGLTLAVAQFFSPMGADTAQAAPVCTTSGNLVTCTYSYTGAAETFIVPADVSSVRIVARGAAGAAGSQNFSTDALGGQGAEVSVDLAVSPNQSLVLVVGGAPTQGNCYSDVRCIGGFNGGGTSYFGGGGGGASDVRIGGTGLAQRVLVAAGGGGGGESFYCDDLVAGGNGGSAGSAGSAGEGCRGGAGGSGGQPGSQSAGGAGGAPDGGNGALGIGGNGGGDTGGGGGGGYYGGGGGGDLELTPDFQDLTAAGGGGGGSNLVPNNGTASLTTQPAAIIVSYTLPDNTPPALTPTVNGTLGANGWYSSDVTVSWSVVDAESTISSQSGCGTQTVTSDTTGVTFTCSATSSGGSSSESVTIKRDATAPTITFVDRTAANSNGWNNGDVTVNWSCSDATSGVVAASVSQTVSSEGANQSATGSCTDNAGNSASATQSGINIDKTAPTISAAASSAPNGTGWYNSDVTVQFTCNDNLSGVVSCPADETLSSEGSAVSSTAQTITDQAGNSSAASNIVTVQIDKTAPVVTVTGVSDGASYTLGSVPTAACDTSDATSGVATQATVDVSGGNGDGTGSFTATCDGAADNAGNSADAVSVSYSVESAGVVMGVCGGYEVRQIGSSYSAAGWSGAIKVGSNGKNTLNGGNGPDLILGLGGNDKINGKGGDDVLCGGDGVDLLQGMAGNDHLDGGPGNDVLNGGSGDYDELLAGDGNDVLLDGDGVANAAGGAGNDVFTLALRNGWRDANGQANFAGLSGGYGNDVVGLAILNSAQFFVDISGDERDDPASPLEGNNDKLALAGVIDPASSIIKFEHQLVLSADADVQIPSEEAGAEYLTEPVGDEREETTLDNQLFLPLINR